MFMTRLASVLTSHVGPSLFANTEGYHLCTDTVLSRSLTGCNLPPTSLGIARARTTASLTSINVWFGPCRFNGLHVGVQSQSEPRLISVIMNIGINISNGSLYQ
jgi:hypothetical protein